MNPIERSNRRTGTLLRAFCLFYFATLLSLVVSGCNLSKEEKVETTLSFDRIADTLKKFDSAVIILKSQGGVLIDTVYHAKVNQTADVQKLKAPHWDGGKVIVSVFGIKDGKLVYQVETILDPVTGTRDSSVILTPDASLSSTVQSLTLLVGDSLGLPPITVSPGNLLNKALEWRANPPELIDIGSDYLKAHQAGSGTLTVRLKSNPDILFNIAVTVSTSGVVPDSIAIKPDSLTVAVGGAPGSLTATIFPSAAPSAVDWKSTDTSIATVDAAGRVFGKGQGNTSIWASSQVRPKITASVLVTVTGAVPVQSVAFASDSLEIHVNGPAADLMVSAIPSNSNQAVTFTLSDPAKASIQNGKISGLQTGNVSVVATSVANPAAKDTLYVKITEPLAVTSVSFAKDSLNLLVGGAAESLSVSVLPSGADPAVTFTLSDPAKASIQNGKISGTQTGNVSVIAASVSNPSAKDTLYVKITGPLAVTKVSFAKDTLDILVGGAAESLMVSVLPAGADPTVTFTLSDPAKASIQKGKITGTAAGTISVIATSASNPAAKDTLIVKVTVPTPNDTIPPLKPLVRVVPSGSTRNLKPVWSWISGGGGGAGSFQISLDKSTFDATTPSVTDTTFTPSANLSTGSHVLYVRERDAAGNWSLPGSAQVEIDTTAPSAPKLLGTSPTSALPRWTWSSGGGGGAGIYRSRLADANFPANAPESADSAYALTTATSGTTYTLYVEERDAAGNWSAPASLPIKYDLTKPTVTIALPQASGTFITSSASVAVSGTSTGPNTITKVEYTLDAGTPSAATLGTGGSWSIASLTLANGQTTTITVTATDNLGNTGQAQLKVLRDSDIPLPPTALVKPTSPTNVALSTWSWGAGADGATGSGLNGNYRWKLNAGTWTETTTASATGVTLAEGTNTFSVEEQDKAGNWSDPLTGTVVLDTKAPDAVTFTGIDGTLTADDTPTWSWTPSTTNGGIGQYVLKLDAGAEFDNTTTSYTPATPLADNTTHTLTVKEKDQVAGVVGTAKSFSYKIKVNPPAAPTVKSAVANLASGGLTNNPGFSWITGGGGNGKYRVKVNAETSYRVNGVAQTTFSLSNTDADGTYTISVSEQDDLGRYGPDGTFIIKLDRTPPVFANAKLLGKSYALRDGYITNASSVIIDYTADGAAKEFSCNLTDNAATLCKGTAITDAAGNSATFQINIWRRSNVVFFQPNGTGDGSSWEDAAGNIQAIADQAGADGKDFWLATGNYNPIAGDSALTIWGKTVNLYGGFFLGNYPTSTSGRTKWGTILGTISFMGSNGYFDGIKFDSPAGQGLGLGGLGTDASPAKFVDCLFKDGFEEVLGGNILFTNCELSGVNSGAVPMRISNGTMVWDGGQIVNNTPSSGDYAIMVSGTATFKNVTISGNKTSFVTSQMDVYGVANIATSVTMPCSDVIWETGSSGTCGGVSHP